MKKDMKRLRSTFLFEFPLQLNIFADDKGVQTGDTCQHIIKFQNRRIGTISWNLLLGN